MERQLPQLNAVELSGDKALLSLSIQPELKYFNGHFSHFPILPGVVQLDWAIHFAAQYFEHQFEFAGMELVKYQHPIMPETLLSLSLEWIRERNKLHFSYFDNDRTYSKGKVKLR
ncbi:3-hydroxyacyl-ACP dehydratase [Vibrio astriarenae]